MIDLLRKFLDVAWRVALALGLSTGLMLALAWAWSGG